MIDPNKINWVNRPPTRKIRIVSPRPGELIEVIAAGELVQVMVHWHAGLKASLPCTCPPDDPTHQGLPAADWRGYLPAVYRTGRRVIVEITRAAVDGCPLLMRPEVVGMWLRISRPGTSKTAAVVCEVNENMRRACDVKPYDPVPRLLEMWGVKLPLLNGHDDRLDLEEGGPDQ
jgi:hypothetical protein